MANKNVKTSEQPKKTTSLAIVLIIICTIFTSAGQIFLKLSASTISPNIIGLLTNVNLIIGMVFYVIGAFIMLIALKRGELSVLYPFIALSFIWVALVSTFALYEQLHILNWIGIVIIIIGVSCIGRGSR